MPPGPPTSDDLRWQSEVDALRHNVLNDIRGAADKLTASLAAGLSIAGALAVAGGSTKVADIALPERAIFTAIVSLAFVSGTTSFLLAALISHGTARDIGPPAARPYADWTRRRSATASSRLRLARITFALAVALVSAASIVALLGYTRSVPPKDNLFVLTTQVDGSLTCTAIAPGVGLSSTSAVVGRCP